MTTDELGIDCIILAQIVLLVADSAKMRTNQRSSLFIHIFICDAECFHEWRKRRNFYAMGVKIAAFFLFVWYRFNFDTTCVEVALPTSVQLA